MKRKIFLVCVLIIIAGTALGQNTNSTADVDSGLTPDSSFYGIEKIVESLEVRIAGAIGGPELASKALTNNAQERLAEARSLANRNQSELASRAIEDYNDDLNRSRALARESNNSDLSSRIDNISRGNIQALEDVRERVPEKARSGIENAIENSKGKKNERPDASGQKSPVNKSGVERRGNGKIPESANQGLGRPLKRDSGNITDSEPGDSDQPEDNDSVPDIGESDSGDLHDDNSIEQGESRSDSSYENLADENPSKDADMLSR